MSLIQEGGWGDKLKGFPRYQAAAATLFQARTVQDLRLPPAIEKSDKRCGELRVESDLKRFLLEFSIINAPIVKLATEAAKSVDGKLDMAFCFPWSEGKPDCFETWRALTVYSDTLDRKGNGLLCDLALNCERKHPIEDRYFPATEMRRILELFENYPDKLTLEAQFGLVMKDPRNFWATTYELALFWRGICRRQDRRLGLDGVSDERRVDLLQKLPVLPNREVKPLSDKDRTLAMNGGNWYHFYTTLAALLGPYLHEEIKKESGEFKWYDRIKLDAHNLVMNHTPLFAAIRKPSDYPCGLHADYDRRGAEMAEVCYQIITGKVNTHDVLVLTKTLDTLQDILV